MHRLAAEAGWASVAMVGLAVVLLLAFVLSLLAWLKGRLARGEGWRQPRGIACEIDRAPSVRSNFAGDTVGARAEPHVFVGSRPSVGGTRDGTDVLIRIPSLGGSTDASAVAVGRAEVELARRHGRVYELADSGNSADAIGRLLRRPVGEVELILALRRRARRSSGQVGPAEGRA